MSHKKQLSHSVCSHSLGLLGPISGEECCYTRSRTEQVTPPHQVPGSVSISLATLVCILTLLSHLLGTCCVGCCQAW